MHNPLSEFIAHARSKDMDHQTIRMLLLSAGWKEKDVAAALASESLDMPVPAPADAGGARDAFFHLLAFTTLYSTVISLIVLAFQFIGRTFSDPAFRDVYYSASADTSTIRWSLAVIFVSYPLFVLISRTLHRESALHPERLVSGVRRWLTYLTLFVTACTLSGDLITLLFYLLQGELTVRFVLKVFAVLVLAGVPFAYYFSAIRLDPKAYASSPIHKRYFWLATLLTLGGVVWGLFLVGSPMQGRAERFDEQRISDLRIIQNEILIQIYGDDRYQAPIPASKTLPKPLPATLDDVAANATYQKVPTTDPETGASYEYTRKGTSYELCATFSLSLDNSYDIFWNHPAGHHCFTFDALDRTGK